MTKTKPLVCVLMIFAFSGLFLSCGTSKKLDSKPSEPAADNLIEKKSIFKKLLEKNDLSIEDRMALYHQLKKEHADEYDFSDERELNQYGYSLLQEGKIKEAIKIFKLLVSEFPDSSNPYDSLGEGYMKDGNDELAILNYEKSVELNPKNTHAIDQITILKGLEILVTDWGKEFFHFPIHFAPDVPYTGVEEVVFPKNWIKPDSTDFWSYVFVWEIGNRKEVTPEELEKHLKLYFDGLMDGVKDDQEAEIMKTRVDFEWNTNPDDTVDILGDLTIYDAFATNKPLNLNARIYSNYCEERGKLILLFRFSPLAYNHPIWDKLRTVQVRKSICHE